MIDRHVSPRPRTGLSTAPTTTSTTRSAATFCVAARTALAALAALVLVAGCGSATTARPVTTVTVYPDRTSAGAPNPSPPPTPAGAPSSVPTLAAAPVTSGPTATAAPQPVRVGKLQGAPAGFADASARVSKAPAADAGATSVVSPSGNIFCAVMNNGAGVGCEVSQGRAPAPASAPCPGGGGGATDVGRVELSKAGALAICNSDTIRVTGAPQLAYGKRWSVTGSPFSCLSESLGVTCVDTDQRHGFFISRATYATF